MTPAEVRAMTVGEYRAFAAHMAKVIQAQEKALSGR